MDKYKVMQAFHKLCFIKVFIIKTKRALIILSAAILLMQGCMPTEMKRVLNKPGDFTADKKNKFLKVHMKDGSLYILDSWQHDDTSKILTGTGDYYNIRRDKMSGNKSTGNVTRQFLNTICYDDISLIETNLLEHHTGNLAAITIVGVPIAVVTGICLVDPKACFGSCPTFYTMNNEKWELAAEGFSSSIFPAFEKRDIDMLYWSENKGENFKLKLTNEALETHVIRYANLLVFPQRENERVFATDKGEFFNIRNLISPFVCKTPEGNCLDKIIQMDRVERFSLANEHNLGKKEEIIFSFANTSNDCLGLIIGGRQTLLTTYLFYQGLAYAGNYAGYIGAKIDNGNEYMVNKGKKIWDKLGGIEIYLKNRDGKWEKTGEIKEIGPIAEDVHLIKLPSGVPRDATFKLKMTQGLWRIDYIALGEIIERVAPEKVEPEYILKDEVKNAEALHLLKDTTEYLVTLPGDSYLINYRLPGNGKYQFFLDAKGYYLEWMRENWLEEQNLAKAKIMFAFPGAYMRMAAKDFKKSEPKMEERFWGSRYVKK